MPLCTPSKSHYHLTVCDGLVLQCSSVGQTSGRYFLLLSGSVCDVRARHASSSRKKVSEDPATSQTLVPARRRRTGPGKPVLPRRDDTGFATPRSKGGNGFIICHYPPPKEGGNGFAIPPDANRFYHAVPVQAARPALRASTSGPLPRWLTLDYTQITPI